MSEILQHLNTEMADVAENVGAGLVRVHGSGGGVGAGAVWHPDGLIITNAHVVRRGPYQVILRDGRRLPASLLAHDSSRDLAALSVDATGLATVGLGSSRDLQPGQWVLALGHPWGILGAVTAGVVTLLSTAAAGCDDPGGVPSWERCHTWLGNPTVDWPGAHLFALALALGVGYLLWRLFGRVFLHRVDDVTQRPSKVDDGQ